MSNSSANRAPLLMALVILLGVGGRWVRGENAPPSDTPHARVALDSQLAQVERAGGRGQGRVAGRSRRPTKGRAGADSASGRAKGPRRRSLTDSQARPALRSERTPIGAVSPDFLARWQAEMAGEGTTSRGRGTGGGRGAGATGARRGANRPAPLVGGEEVAPIVIDLESASAAEIDRLPRIGPSLARRIVEDRAAHGPFRSLDGLQRVRGVGPGVARQLQGRVTFGHTGRP